MYPSVPRLTLQSIATDPLGEHEATLTGDEQLLVNPLSITPPVVAPHAKMDSLDALIAAHEPRIRRLAHRLLGWRDALDVDDVVQDVFLAAWRHQHRFRGEASVATWLSAVTINRCRSQHRRRLLRLRWLREWHHSATSPAVSAETDRDESDQRVRSAVAALNAKDREVIVLFYLEELSLVQMASLLKISSNAVGVRLHRARQRLREKLKALGV